MPRVLSASFPVAHGIALAMLVSLGLACGSSHAALEASGRVKPKAASKAKLDAGKAVDAGIDAGGGLDAGRTCQGRDCADASLDTGAGAHMDAGVDAGPGAADGSLACPTTISGTVYDPAGNNPIYNAIVFVPSTPLAAFERGPSCAPCADLYTGAPRSAAATDAAGKFSLAAAPAGTDVLLVVQLGKWRRQFTLPAVIACQDNAVPDKLLTLPSNHEQGDMPEIAISTGGGDTLECLLRRVGIAATEYTPGAMGPGHVHVFQGSDFGATMAGMPAGGGGFVIPGQGYTGAAPNTSPPAPQSYKSLWDSVDHLMPYDIVLLSCEGQETLGMNQQALHDYTTAGGRVLASHLHYAWFASGPFASEKLAAWSTGVNSIGDINAEIVTALADGRAFRLGLAFAQWLESAGALTAGKLPVSAARHNADVGAANPASQAWMVAAPDSMAPGATEQFSFNTPTDATITASGPAFCGRVVFSDLHAGVSSGDDPSSTPVPAECKSGALSAQEKAIEFALFDLASCVTPHDRAPELPFP